MSEQISASVPNLPSSSKDIHGFDEEVDSNQGQQSDLYLQYLADGLYSVWKASPYFLKCLLFCKERPATE